MSRPLQYALAGVVGAVFLGLVAYFYVRGWRQDAVGLFATLLASILGIAADRLAQRQRLLRQRELRELPQRSTE